MATKNLVEGQPAPEFRLPTKPGNEVALSDLAGQPVVLYFYPKDNTPGCTIEANEFQKLRGEFEKAGAVVLGVSPDSVASHCKFAKKYNLGFDLLADEDHKTAEAYGVWVEKNRFGKKYWGIQRATFLIGADGTLQKKWPKVKPEGHAEEVLESVKAL